MKVVIKAMTKYTKYSVVPHLKEIEKDGTKVTVFSGRPKLKVETEYKWNTDILSFDGDFRYNREGQPFRSCSYNQLNISEDETVNIVKEVFRADLNELHLYSDRLNAEININKEAAEKGLEKYLEDFNTMMIESNDKMKTYCDLHKLFYWETDAVELFRLLHPNGEMKIKDGKMFDDNIYVTESNVYKYYKEYISATTLDKDW